MNAQLPGGRKHSEAIQRTLGRADAAAASGSYADALAWLRLVEAIGDELPRGYDAKRRVWVKALSG